MHKVEGVSVAAETTNNAIEVAIKSSHILPF